MVRFTSRSCLHLTPELIDGEYTQPFYAQVAPKGRISRDVASEHVVSAGEVKASGRRSLLRCPVSAIIGEQVHYGQVIKVDGDNLTIRSEGEELVAGLADTDRRAPSSFYFLSMFNLAELSGAMKKSEPWNQRF
ncbi:hypothetical protein F443_03090 [Phytophthora nicotianae P1569]|uniref:Uncharacterized protein n=1 Tax=Phytophthora nicotianae P1569 TaxID=1317065 RepID=V9FSI0_PHYNI|nr:hypothetical protein F443_03090 [Phytophthora nicotianae P1569]